nr:immunoglobulin light chain junction region [Macaca mulatta]MOW45344.1 immunoglobulin light chain junction region [Macaca mulatta]
CQQYNSDVRTF